MPRSMGFVTAVVLDAVRQGRLYGADIMESTGLSGGTVYKVLRRLERRGHIAGRWEDAETAEAERRPRRRYYQVTKDGVAVLERALEHFRAIAPGGLVVGAAGDRT